MNNTSKFINNINTNLLTDAEVNISLKHNIQPGRSFDDMVEASKSNTVSNIKLCNELFDEEIKDSTTESELISKLKNRFTKNLNLTRCGILTISINPYTGSQDENTRDYISQILKECLIEQENKYSVIISGESGSGKTECSKKLLMHLGVDIAMDINIILEAFGNCKTQLNPNSSRFAKMITIEDGMKIEGFLLERSRVTDCRSNECNFHIFEYILSDSEFVNRKDINSDYIKINYRENIKEELIEIKTAIMNLGIDYESIKI